MKHKTILLVFLYLLLLVTSSCNLQAQKELAFNTKTNIATLPFTDVDTVIPLRDLLDVNLQKRLEIEINKNPLWKSLIADKKMAIAIVDLSNKNNVKFARINGNHMMYAASLPKIVVLLAATDAIEQGTLVETEEIKHDMKIMISNSNNAATTRMIDRIGYEKIEEVLTSEAYQLYDEEQGGGLWVGKRYGGGGDTNREPLKNLSHAATVTQVARFYYLLVQGKLINENRSQQMLSILENPALHHKFVHTLDKIAPKAKVYRKSGSWQNFHSDSVIVWEEDSPRKYILVALLETPDGEKIIRDLVMPVERVLRIKNKTFKKMRN